MKPWLGIFIAVFSLSTGVARAEVLEDEMVPLEEPAMPAEPAPRPLEPAYRLTAKESRMAFALIGGVTTLSSGGNGLALTGQSSRYNFMAAVQPDFHGKYFGVELEGFYTGASFTSGYAQTDYRYFGGTAAGKVQYPLQLGGTRITPKLGVGYGFLSQNNSQNGVSAAAAASAVSATLNTHGAFALLGAEFEFFHRVILWADFAISFYSRSSLSFGGAAAGLTSSLPYSDYQSRFDRFRIGVWVRVLPKFLLGVQFIRRGITVDGGGSGFAGSLPVLFIPQNQYGIGALFQF